MKQSFNNKTSNSIAAQPSEGEETEVDESLFYSAVDTLKSSDRSTSHVNMNHSSDQSDYEESPKASAIYLESAVIEDPELPITISSSNIIIRKHKDLKWAFLFVLTSLMWLLSGIIIMASTSIDSTDANAYNSIMKSLGIITLMVTITLFICIIWTYSLSNFTKKSSLGTMVMMPMILFCSFLWVSTKSFQSNPTDKTLLLLALLLLAIDAIYIKLVKKHLHHIPKTASIIEYAFNIINSNTNLILLSLVLFAAFILFTVIWMMFFIRIWLMGDIDHENRFILKDRVYVISLFYIFYYMWSCTIIINIQRFALSFITSQQYFHQHEPSKDSWKTVLLRAMTTSFGTLVLCSLILRMIYFISSIGHCFKSYFEMDRVPSPIYSIMDWLDSLSMNHFIVSFIGMTQDGFSPAIQSSNSLFRRNLLTGRFSDSTTQLVLLVSPCVFCFCTGFYTLISFGALTGLLVAMVLFFTTQFFSCLVLGIVECRFLCYAIDIDTSKIRSPETHTIYSYFD